jgi:hypothetical protein
MGDFELLRAVCSQRELNEQTRISTIYGGAEDRDPAREADQPGVTVSEVCRRHGSPVDVLVETSTGNLPKIYQVRNREGFHLGCPRL